MKRIISLLVLLVLIPSVSAGISKLNIPMTFEFRGDSEFNLWWDGGIKNVKWDNSSFPGNISFDAMIYRDLNESLVCSDQNNLFYNLSQSMSGVLDICGRLADNNNISLVMEFENAQFSLGLQTEKLDACKRDLNISSEKSLLYDSCNNAKNNLQSQYEICSKNLEEKIKGSKSNWIIVALITAIVTYFITKGKKPVPSEMSEEGYEEEF